MYFLAVKEECWHKKKVRQTGHLQFAFWGRQLHLVSLCDDNLILLLNLRYSLECESLSIKANYFVDLVYPINTIMAEKEIDPWDNGHLL